MEVVGVVVGAAPVRGCVDGERDGTVVVRIEVAAVEDDGAELLVNETINAMAAAPTRTATTATVPINQRSGRAGGGVAPDGAGGGVRSGRTGGRLSSRAGSGADAPRRRPGAEWRGRGQGRGARRLTGAAHSALHGPEGTLTRGSWGRFGRTFV